MAQKVLMGLTYYLPNISGVTQYAVILAEELVKRKYKVEIYCGKAGGAKNETINGVKIIREKGFQIGKGFVMPGYFYKSYGVVRRNDVVICHLPSVESFWLAVWAKILHKKLIIIHHCEFQLNGTISNFLIGALTYPIHFMVYLMADTIISYTEDYARTSIFLRYFFNKIKFILPPIKINPPPTPSLDRAGAKKSSQSKVVGFVGRIGWEKGIDVLVKAMKKVEAKLMLVGPYKDVAGDKTYEKLKNSGVEFVGPIDHEKLNKYYSLFDCLVLPSTNNLETFGIVQAEAMVCGCPVVASNLPGVRVPVKMTGMGEIARIGDSDDLAKKINIVLKNGKKYYQKMAKNLYKFDYLKTVDEIEKCLK